MEKDARWSQVRLVFSMYNVRSYAFLQYRYFPRRHTSSNNDSPSFRGLRYPDVSFKYEGADGYSDETCRMPTKAVGPYIVVDTIPGRCQMYVILYTKFSEVAI